MYLHVNQEARSFYRDSFANICVTMDIVKLNKVVDSLDVSRQKGLCQFQNNLNNEDLRRLPVALYEMINYKDNLAYILNSVETKINFYNKSNVTLPFLDSFSLLKHKIQHSATEFISRLKILNSYQQDIVEIFANSELNTSRRYRTITKSGNLFISGQNSNDIWSLSGIAHELGHCLYEKNVKNSFLKPFYSELIAHVFEEQIVSFALRDNPQILKEWKHYQFAVDLLNLYFFILEWHPSSIKQQYGTERFDSASLLFRESLFLIPGYQLIYGFASAWRCLVRKQDKSIIDLLEYLINATNSNDSE